jgi:hypothetical protein
MTAQRQPALFYTYSILATWTPTNTPVHIGGGRTMNVPNEHHMHFVQSTCPPRPPTTYSTPASDDDPINAPLSFVTFLGDQSRYLFIMVAFTIGLSVFLLLCYLSTQPRKCLACEGRSTHLAMKANMGIWQICVSATTTSALPHRNSHIDHTNSI